MPVRVLQVDPAPELEPWTFERDAVERAGGELVIGDCRTESDVIAQGRNAEILWLAGEPLITRDVMAALPACRLIVRWGVGFDQIPVRDATELGIAVANAPEYGSDDVAEHAIALLFAATRRVAWFHASMVAGGYPSSADYDTHRMRGRTLGILGVGRIGEQVALRGLGLGLRVIGFDKYRPEDELRAMGVEPVSLDRLLDESDYLSLHVPLSDETRHLLDGRSLARLRPHAILVNTSRGPVIDEPALIALLRKRRIAAAALDVFEREPLEVDSPLRGMDNVVLSPHAGGFSVEALRDLREDMCVTVADWIAGSWSKRVVNPEVRPRLRPRLAAS